MIKGFKNSKNIKRHESFFPVSIKMYPKSLYWPSILIIQLVLLVAQTHASDEIRVGGLFERSVFTRRIKPDEETAFRQAIEAVNADKNILPQSVLLPQVEHVSDDDSFQVARKACSIIQSGVGAIFGPQSPKTSTHIESICNALTIPHFVNQWDITGDEYSVNLYPPLSTLSKAYTDILKSLGWKRFCIIYENNNGLIRVQELIKNEYFDVSLRQLPETDDYRPMLEEVKENGMTNIVLDVERENIFTVLKQAQQVGLLTSYHNYFITSLDLHTIDLEDFRHGGTGISGLQLIDPQNSMVQQVIQDLQNRNKKHNNMETEVALIYDAVLLFAKALDELERSVHINITSLECDGDATWEHGASLLHYIRLAQINGLTGLVRFDSEGIRKDVTLDVIKLTKGGLQKIGSWDQTSGVNHTKADKDVQAEVEDSIKDKTLIVTAVLSDPYIMLTDTSEELSGNDRYEGFCIDFMYEIAKILGFNFTVVLSPDGRYGRQNPETSQWNGMIGELISHRADLAIGDITITNKREQAIDFSHQWMETGIGLLYKTPIRQAPIWYIFLAPFSIEVWIYMALTYVGVSLLLFALARLSPYEGVVNPLIQEENAPKRENQFSLDNSLWFTVGSFMQQKTDQKPRAASTRIVALMWWFFVLVMICSYTANLVVFFIRSGTGDRSYSPITSVNDLAYQERIKYGTTKGGSTKNFFETSKIGTYHKIHQNMEWSNPSVYTESNKEGVQRVIESNRMYAFFMETSTIDYIVQRRCDLMKIGSPLDQKGYGIALPPGSPYGDLINEAILQLKQDGIVHMLKKKWWYEKRGGGRCRTRTVDEGKEPPFIELGVSYAGGVFVILLIGMGIATLVAICEFAWNYLMSKKQSNKAEMTVT